MAYSRRIFPRRPISLLQWFYIKKRNSQCGVKSHTVQICHSNGITILNLRLSDEYSPQRNQMNSIEDAWAFATWTLEKEQRMIQEHRLIREKQMSKDFSKQATSREIIPFAAFSTSSIVECEVFILIFVFRYVRLTAISTSLTTTTEVPLRCGFTSTY